MWKEKFAWFPVQTLDFGWVWLRKVIVKQIPYGWKRSTITEEITGCWYRIPEDEF